MYYVEVEECLSHCHPSCWGLNLITEKGGKFIGLDTWDTQKGAEEVAKKVAFDLGIEYHD